MSTEIDDKSERPSSAPLASDVIPFLSIKASRIEKWPAEDKTARDKLAVLLRWLIHSTAIDCIQADFPGYENSERPGWDGFVEVNTATPWIPKGKSGWELSTEERVGGKANRDYRDRIKSTLVKERKKTAFVFVTTHNWAGKQAWVKKKMKKKEWRKVIALDASDLEQWLERSIPAQVWLAKQLKIDTDGLETLENAWIDWVNIGSKDIQLSHELFKHAVSEHQKQFKEFLNKDPSLLLVSADSRDEALAFLYCLFNKTPEYKENRRQVVIASKPEPMKKMLPGLSPKTVLVARTKKAQKAFGFASNNHKIAISPRGAVDPHYPVLEVPVNQIKFIAALSEMGVKNNSEINRYVRESGCSPTVLRRMISSIPEISKPKWVNNENAKKLIPLALIGAWCEDNPSDCEIISKLANQEYSKIESNFAELLSREDSPVWTERGYCGVVSKIDALIAIAKYVTKTNINSFFKCAEDLLSENNKSDANLLVSKDIRGPVRVQHHSDALDNSVCDSLVLLAVHGNEIFPSRLGINFERRVAELIHNLLAPLTHEKLLAHDARWHLYAEAAPLEFLSIIESELEKSNPLFDKFLSNRLLWELEELAWRHLERATLILAKLSRFATEANSMNMPIEILSIIYCSWHPQTYASLSDRRDCFNLLVKKYPDIARQLLFMDFSQTSIMIKDHYGWRNNTVDTRDSVTVDEINEFRRAALDAVLKMKQSSETLGGLVKHIDAMENEHQQRIWKLIDEWGKTATDADKAYLREQIRQHALIEKKSDHAQNVYEKLVPQDLVYLHLWLFPGDIVKLLDKDLDYHENVKQIEAKRKAALEEILGKHGIKGAVDLLMQSDNPYAVGKATASCILDTEAQLNFFHQCLADEGNLGSEGLMGFLGEIESEAFLNLLKEVNHKTRVQLLKHAPFSSKTWRLLDQLKPNIKQDYWQTVERPFSPFLGLEKSDVNEAAKCFFASGRLLEAFLVVIKQPVNTDILLLKNILFAVAKSGDRPEIEQDLFESYLANTFKALNNQNYITEDELAFLEFSFLNFSTIQIPYLEQKIAKEPDWFVKAIINLHFPEECSKQKLWNYHSASVSPKETAEKIYLMLDKIQRIPGLEDDVNVNAQGLEVWIKEVQGVCKQNDAWFKIVEREIGRLLSRSPKGQDGEWPAYAVCKAMEHCQSESIATYFINGVFNRPDHRKNMPGEGGEQERQLAEKFHSWAKQHKALNYNFAAKVLEKIAQRYENDLAASYDRREDIRNRLGN